MRKDVIISIGFLIVPMLIFLLYSTSSKLDVKNNIVKINRDNFINCKKAPEFIQDYIENLTGYLNGIFYDKKILLCVDYKNKIYCLQSNITKINNLSIIYFDKICYIQSSIDRNLPYVIVKYGENISSAIFSDSKLKKEI